VLKHSSLSYLLCVGLLLGCSSDSKSKSGPESGNGGNGSGSDGGNGSPANAGEGGSSSDAALDPSQMGAYVVGTVRVEIDAAGGRTLPLQLWYPAVDSARAEAEAGRPTEDFEPAGEKQDKLKTLIAEAPDGCTRKTMNAADAPDVFTREEPWPLLVFSHCMDCIRFSAFSIAEHLASLGFVVAAPDHVDGTLYENSGTLNAEFLKVRAADVRSVLDVLLDPNAGAIPEGLRGKLDSTRVGAFGHSYGSVTTGLVLQTDARVKAGVMIAAPPQSPILTGVTLAEIDVPGMFILATEDGSISAAGNVLIENNYSDYPKPAWLIKVEDAGHWSFSDIAGIGGNFKPGCGMGMRATGASFSYLDIETARDIGKAYIAAFFALHLLGDSKAGAYLNQGTPNEVVTVAQHD